MRNVVISAELMFHSVYRPAYALFSAVKQFVYGEGPRPHKIAAGFVVGRILDGYGSVFNTRQKQRFAQFVGNERFVVGVEIDFEDMAHYVRRTAGSLIFVDRKCEFGVHKRDFWDNKRAEASKFIVGFPVGYYEVSVHFAAGCGKGQYG